MGKQIHEYMTVGAWTADCGQPLAVARELMEEHGIRHLPVLESGVITGLLSARDLHFIGRLPGVSAEITIDSAMRREPYVVEAEEDVASVSREMATRKIGSAIVARHGTVIGIFTTTDALELLADTIDGAGD